MTFRYARHTRNLEALTRFYTRILGLDIVGSFEGHDGINGVMIGPTGAQWHLEFTESAEPPVHAFDEEDNLVFYPADRLAYDTILERIRQQQIPEIAPRNSYWEDHGIMILDPDGYRVVISSDRIRD
ncbi:MAG: VOC family protein [Lewinellaceae bacterium]|nr:VOC family protein [Saprospiraceae bacterium]MCB9313940.1 VOC family protein [Lewinellaceae bacterium]HRW76706.1 VOC family protein [Saprospiraceae bacterium]